MDEINELLYDDDDAKIEALQAKKEARHLRRKQFQFYLVIIVIVVGIIYFCSDASKITSIKVFGNLFYSEQEILELANVDYQSRFLLKPKKLMEHRLESDDLIKEVNIEKSFDGRLSIEVKEELIIGYFVEKNKNYVLLHDGSVHEIHSKNLDAIVHYPLIDGFSKKERAHLAKAFSPDGAQVRQDMISMISEIRPHQESYDQHMVKIVMQDGNTVYTSYDSVFLLNSYKQTLKSLKKNHVCFVMDANTKTYITEDCKGFK